MDPVTDWASWPVSGRRGGVAGEKEPGVEMWCLDIVEMWGWGVFDIFGAGGRGGAIGPGFLFGFLEGRGGGGF